MRFSSPTFAKQLASTLKSWNEWGTLRSVIVGHAVNNFPPHEPAFKPLFKPEIEQLVQSGNRPQAQVLEAREQLDGLVKMLESHNVEVFRPDVSIQFDLPVATLDWSVPRQYGPSCPRDVLLVVGQEVIQAPMSFRSRYYEHLAYRALLSQIRDRDASMRWVAAPKARLLDSLYRPNYPRYGPEANESGLLDLVQQRIFKTNESEVIWDAADVVRFGKDLFCMSGTTTNNAGYEWLRSHYSRQGIRVHQLHFDKDTNPMHIDVNVVPLNSSTCMVNYGHGVPEWFVQLLKDNGWNVFGGPPFEQTRNPEMDLCGQYLSLNTLSIDPQRVLVSDSAHTLIDLLADKGFTPIPVPIDCLNSFGGGPHCVTLDLHRDGKLESYFPLLDEIENKGGDAIFTSDRPWPTAPSVVLFSKDTRKRQEAVSQAAPVKAARHIIQKHTPSEPFALFDRGEVLSLIAQWKFHFPKVRPFYAVKASTFTPLLQILHSQGFGFDVASEAEIADILSLGALSENCLVSNVHKTLPTVRKMEAHGICLSTVDSTVEILKLSEICPGSKVLIRIAVDVDPTSVSKLDSFGAVHEEVEELLLLARKVGIACVGVMFHIGTPVSNTALYHRAIEKARHVFELGFKLGHNFHILDLGGGFTKENIAAASLSIHAGLNNYFQDVKHLEVIAEPGRFFSASTMCIVCNILGVRQRTPNLREVWLGDGVYGGFDEAAVRGGVLPQPLVLSSKRKAPIDTRLYGPTCCSLDVVADNLILDSLSVDDWLLFPDMGAYSWYSCSTTFNGFDVKKLQVFEILDDSPKSQL